MAWGLHSKAAKGKAVGRKGKKQKVEGGRLEVLMIEILQILKKTSYVASIDLKGL